MKKTAEENNKKIVLEAFDTLFNKRDYAAAEKFWSLVRLPTSGLLGRLGELAE